MSTETIAGPQDIALLGTILGVWAHPDDETYSMAGIIASAILAGQKVICVTATRGEAGVQDEARWPAGQLAAIRSSELASAYALLGVKNHYWLDYPDGGCSQVNAEAAVDRIAALITTYNPDSIFTFGLEGLTGHDDHKTVSKWTTLAAQQTGSKAVIYHAVQTTEQYKSMQVADEQFNIFFNIKKPPLCRQGHCAIHFVLPEDLFQIKLTALKAMPSQTEAMLKQFEDSLRSSFGTEAFIIGIGKSHQR